MTGVPSVLALRLALGLATGPAKDPGPDQQMIARAGQLLLVVAPEFASTRGTLQRLARPAPGRPFNVVGPPLAVSLGRAGLGWRSDRDAPEPLIPGPRKAEGDGRAPAGVLPLGDAWGYATRPPAGTRLRYHAMTAADRCVDDPASPSYNRLLPEPAGGPPWRSAEVLRRDDELYRNLVVVGYNVAQPLPGAGSCIFLHIARDPPAPTAGCTALRAEDLDAVLRFLDPARHPVLLQLPAAALPAAARRYGLPQISEGAAKN